MQTNRLRSLIFGTAILTLSGLTGGCVTMDELATAIDKSNAARDAQRQRYNQQPRYYALVQDSGLCLDVHGPDRNRNGGRVQLWECHGGENQTFMFEGTSIVTPSGMCLDVDGHSRTRNGGRIQVWECLGNVNKTWYYSPNTGVLRNAAGLCLDADGHTRHRNGAKVQIWECRNNVNQTWYTEPLG